MGVRWDGVGQDMDVDNGVCEVKEKMVEGRLID